MSEKESMQCLLFGFFDFIEVERERERERVKKKEFMENRDMEVLSGARISGEKYAFLAE